MAQGISITLRGKASFSGVPTRQIPWYLVSVVCLFAWGFYVYLLFEREKEHELRGGNLGGVEGGEDYDHTILDKMFLKGIKKKIKIKRRQYESLQPV